MSYKVKEIGNIDVVRMLCEMTANEVRDVFHGDECRYRGHRLVWW